MHIRNVAARARLLAGYNLPCMRPSSAESTGVVGRAAEVARLMALMERAMSGRGVAVLVEGEPGIGKTMLVSVVEAECRRREVRVLRGKADELDQRLPFAAITSCLGVTATAASATDADLARIAALVRGDRQRSLIAAPDIEFIVTEAILDLVDTWCTAGPVALLLDDLQWADLPSLLVLHRLSTMIGELPLLVVGAYRSMPQRDELDGLRRRLHAGGAPTITLSPLADDAVAELVAQLVGAPAGPGLLRLVAGAAGNPMYVTELVNALLRDGSIELTEGRAEVKDERGRALSSSLVETIAQRLNFLSQRAREILRVAALLGSGFDVTELSAVLHAPAIELWDVLTEAVRCGVLLDAGSTLTFRHDLIRQVFAEDLPPAARTALHLEIGRALADSGAPVARVAEHLLVGPDLDGPALDWLARAAPDLVLRAPGTAVDLLRRAIASVGDRPPADALRCHLARALLWAGQPAEAAQYVQLALAANRDHRGEAALRWLLAQAHFLQGNQQDAVDEAARALALPDVSPSERVRFQALTAQSYFYLGQMGPAVAAGMAVAASASTGDGSMAGYGRYVLASVRLAQGRVLEALDLIDRAIVEMTGREIRPGITPHLVRGLCLMDMDRFDEADREYEVGLRDSGLAMVALPLGWYHWARADLRFFEGRWDDASSEIEAGLDALDYLGIRQVLRSVAALIAVHRGDPTTYADLVMKPDTSSAGRIFGWHREWARALTWEARGEPERALDVLLDRWARGIETMPQPHMLHLCPDVARLACRLDDRSMIDAVATAAEEFTAVFPAVGMRTTAMMCRGVADQQPDLLRQAAGAYHEVGRTLNEGMAWECAATVLARLGHAAESRRALDAALDVYERLDARWDAGRAEAQMEGLGVRPSPHGVDRRPTTGWEALTETERNIAALVAKGRSNPEIAGEMYLSRRTVQHRVSSILAKLGLASRFELAVAERRHRDRAGQE
jgi:DNA-binding NarL/FixJ family response regulator